MSKTRVYTIVLATLTVLAIGIAAATPDRPYIPPAAEVATPTR